MVFRNWVTLLIALVMQDKGGRGKCMCLGDRYRGKLKEGSEGGKGIGGRRGK